MTIAIDRLFAALRILASMAVLVGAASVGHVAMAAPEEGLVEVAMLTYGNERKTSVCFSSRFLLTVRAETEINIAREFVRADLSSAELFNHPFAIMTGEGAFTLSNAEVENLRRYLTQGGFLLASAGCSDRQWRISMLRAMEQVFPDQSLLELPVDHDVFQTIYDITSFQTKRRVDVQIYGIEIDGRLAVVFSPQGLNDTKNAGGGCCCCGGNEIRNAKEINANILAYALMR